MDKREFEHWVKEAELAHLDRRIEAAEAARVAMIEGDGYQEYIGGLVKLRNARAAGKSDKDLQRDAWNALKERGRG